MIISVSNKIILKNAPSPFANIVKERLTMPNPAYTDAVKMKRWTGHIPKTLSYYEHNGNDLIVPRGFARQLIQLATQGEVSWKVEDRRRVLPDVDVVFKGTLRDYQQEAIADVLKHDHGVLNAATGSGKTTMTLYTIAARKQPCLVIVHTKELLNQWIDRATQFMNMERDEIGVIGDGKRQIGKRLTVGIVNSIYPIADEIKQHFGFIVVDECHHCPSRTFTEAISQFDCRYMLGLSATPYRRDGLSKLIYWHLGDMVHQVDKHRLIQTGSILKPEIVTRQTHFSTSYDPSGEYSKMLSELAEDADRNHLIVSDVIQEAAKCSGIILVLSDRKSHCEILTGMLTDKGIKAAMLIGDLSSGKRREVIEKINTGEVDVIVATGSLVGEGFDLPALSSLFLVTPIKFSGRVLQYLGRVLRPAPGKCTPKVFDYVDPVGVLVASARTRLKVYQSAA